jgi:hypothetical protein
MKTMPSTLALVEQKLAAFEYLQPEFERCFLFVQDVHGQKRFPTFPVQETVYYLHSLWVCEAKDRLLNVPHTIVRYEGGLCLALLARWQNGETSGVVDFLQRKLDGLPFASLTSQIQQARQDGPGYERLLERLIQGRQMLLCRMQNMALAFESIFALAQEELQYEVQQACATYGHRPEQIALQQHEMQTPLYDVIPHPSLARRNILAMNQIGSQTLAYTKAAVQVLPEHTRAATDPPAALAEQVISGYHELISPWYNNVLMHPFVDRPEHGDGLVV